MTTPSKQRALNLLAGQDRVTPALAAKAIGRTDLAALTDHGLTPGDDGLISTADVLAVLDRRTATATRRRRAAGPSGRWDAALTLVRDGEASWEVRLPWGLAGWISVMTFAGEPLARPARTLGVWLAEWPVPGADGDVVEAAVVVSARAAQVLLAGRHPQVVLPDWAGEVRPLTHDLAVAAQVVAENKQAGRPAPDDTGLTEWELAEVVPTPNPRWLATERFRSRRGAAWVADNDDRITVDDAEVAPTPGGLALQTAGNPLQQVRWSVKAVAAHLGVKDSTVRSWNARGQMPAPDGRDDNGSPWWLPDTIEDWDRTRPGSGNWSS